MTLAQYWTTLVKQWRLIIISCLVVGAGAAVGSRLITPVYQSTALVQVAVHSNNTNQSEYTDLLASSQLVQTEAVLATSGPVLREVASHYPGLTVGQLLKEVSSNPKLNTQLFEITVLDSSPTRAAALANDIAETLIKQQLQVNQQGTGQGYLLLAQPAQPNSTPAQPNNLLNTAVGLLAGLCLGMILAVLFEQLDKRVRTPEALTKLLNLPLLATIYLVNSPRSENTVNLAEHTLHQGSNVEAYRLLRTAIGFSAIDKPLQSLVVTSALPAEGKSTIAMNLAMFMAKVGKNTLLVDANLRNPSLQHLLNLPTQAMGLSNAVLAIGSTTSSTTNTAFSFEQSIRPIQTPTVSTVTSTTLSPFLHRAGGSNLWVMPSGPLPPDPAEMLESRAMEHLLAMLANSAFEVIIFDTPSLLGLSDASVLASKVDGTLLVVDITRATKEPLIKLNAALVRARAYVLGCVVNKQPSPSKEVISYYSGNDQNTMMSTQENTSAISTRPLAPAFSLPLMPAPLSPGLRKESRKETNDDEVDGQFSEKNQVTRKQQAITAAQPVTITDTGENTMKITSDSIRANKRIGNHALSLSNTERDGKRNDNEG